PQHHARQVARRGVRHVVHGVRPLPARGLRGAAPAARRRDRCVRREARARGAAGLRRRLRPDPAPEPGEPRGEPRLGRGGGPRARGPARRDPGPGSRVTAMSPSLETVVAALERIAPLGYAAEWDNVGLLVEPWRADRVARCLLAIDPTHAVVEEAEAAGAR